MSAIQTFTVRTKKEKLSRDQPLCFVSFFITFLLHVVFFQHFRVLGAKGPKLEGTKIASAVLSSDCIFSIESLFSIHGTAPMSYVRGWPESPASSHLPTKQQLAADSVRALFAAQMPTGDERTALYNVTFL